MTTIAQHFLARRSVRAIRKIVLAEEERALLPLLDALVKSHPAVKFGSYP